jgi:hypothetical protein
MYVSDNMVDIGAAPAAPVVIATLPRTTSGGFVTTSAPAGLSAADLVRYNLGDALSLTHTAGADDSREGSTGLQPDEWRRREDPVLPRA